MTKKPILTPHSEALSLFESSAASFFIMLVLAAPVFLTASGPHLYAKLFWILCLGHMSFRIFVTGRIAKWRSLFFMILAASFLVEFKAKLLGLTGQLWRSSSAQEVPYCHIAIVSTFLNKLYGQYLAILNGNWSLWSGLIAGTLFWLLGTLTIGQGWCSWGCFYGGLDTAFSKILPKPMFRLPRLTKKARDFSLALLMAVLLISLVRLEPVYCLWICPLKITTAFLDSDSKIRMIQTILLISTGVFFIILLPLLMKKRTFCTFLCPFGAWQAIAGKISPFRVKIDPETCTHCKQCAQVCPVYALDLKGMQENEVLSYCNRCGDCMDVCPSGAIHYSTFLGSRLSKKISRTFFLISAWLVGGSISLLFVPNVILKIFNSIALSS